MTSPFGDPEPPGVDSSDAYLVRRYHDARQQLDTWRVYREDGRVEVYDGSRWRVRWRFAPQQVAQAKSAIRASRVADASDLDRPDDTYDTAVLEYRWRIDGSQGRIVNRAYPAHKHPEMDRLRAALRDLESAAATD